jgi:predicted ribonuclease YlaK
MKAGVYITEAQNFDIEMMRLTLQRIGEDSICIIDGDNKHQLDSSLYEGDRNGMTRILEVFKGEDCFGTVELQNIHRSKIAKIAEKL